MSDIAVVLRVDRSSATRAVDRLEAAGLVARRADPDDARGIGVAATQAGRAPPGRVRDRAPAVLAELRATVPTQGRDSLAEHMACPAGQLVDACPNQCGGGHGMTN